MPATEIYDFVGRLNEPERSALIQLRRDILTVVPDASEASPMECPPSGSAKTITGSAAFPEPPELLTSQWLCVRALPRPLQACRSNHGGSEVGVLARSEWTRWHAWPPVWLDCRSTTGGHEVAWKVLSVASLRRRRSRWGPRP